MIRVRETAYSALTYLIAISVMVLLWWAVSVWLSRPYLLPLPKVVGREAWKLLLTGEVLKAITVSGKRLLLAYLLAGAAGTTLGVLMGSVRWVGHLFEYLIEMLRPISGIALIPLLLVVFGVSEALPVGIIFYAAIFPFVLNTASGVRHVDRRLVNAAKVLGAGPWRTFFRVVLPAAVPDIVTGARVAAGNCWMALIVAELVGAPNGLGYVIGFAQELGNSTAILAWIIYIGLSGYLLDVVLRWVHQRLTPWAAGLKVGG